MSVELQQSAEGRVRGIKSPKGEAVTTKDELARFRTEIKRLNEQHPVDIAPVKEQCKAKLAECTPRLDDAIKATKTESEKCQAELKALRSSTSGAATGSTNPAPVRSDTSGVAAAGTPARSDTSGIASPGDSRETQELHIPARRCNAQVAPQARRPFEERHRRV